MDIKAIPEELHKIQSLEQLEEFYQKYLGKKGKLNEAFKKMGSLSPEEKKKLGQKLSEGKTVLTQGYQQKEQEISTLQINKKLAEDIVDISITEPKMKSGTYSIITKVRRETEDICRSLGFTIEYGHEVVSKFENFESVNIPLTHPATEMHDTIYLKEKDNNGENLILRTHTSAMQNLLIQKHGLPLKAVVPAKVYRYENVDATHDTMFYQLEGMYIDKDISIAHFKDMMTKLLSAILKKDVEIRMRPSYFPFVEPGFEIDARYEITDRKTGKKEMSDRLEILGAGMIHPNVLKEANVDPKERKGFAFGIGINRVAAIRYGIKDIRLMTNGDLRFAKSFA